MGHLVPLAIALGEYLRAVGFELHQHNTLVRLTVLQHQVCTVFADANFAVDRCHMGIQYLGVLLEEMVQVFFTRADPAQ
ncbi:hypothetical protein D3C78_1658080 [compost metagenome]